MTTLTICLSVYNRWELLKRALWSYAAQEDQDFSVVIVDDGSDPPIPDWLHDVDAPASHPAGMTHLLRSEKPHGSHTWGYNECLDVSRSDVLLFTHPEVLLPPPIVGIAKARAAPNTFLTFKPLWVTPEAQAKIDIVDWKKDCRVLREIPELYENRAYPPEIMRSWNRDQEVTNKWESTTTFAMLREDLLKIGGFNEFDKWGPDDPDFAGRRHRLGIRTEVVMEELVFHQWHEPTELSAARAIEWLGEFHRRTQDALFEPRSTNSHIDFRIPEKVSQ